MESIPIRYRLSGWLWDRAPAVLPRLRALKRRLALWRYRWRARRRELEARVVTEMAPGSVADPPITHPAIEVHLGAGADESLARRFLDRQTETSVILGEPEPSRPATYVTSFGPELDEETLRDLPATWLESQLLSAVAADLEWTTPGWAPPTEEAGDGAAHGPVAVHGPHLALARRPRGGAAPAAAVLGRVVPHLTAPDHLLAASVPPPCGVPALLERGGAWALRHDVDPGTVLRHSLRSIHRSLAALPVFPGPRTALFLLPYLAVGGAERLLFDLLAGLGGRYRSLVVTLEPHSARLGQMVDVCRQHTPHVYTLGEWLPREAHRDAILHLCRRYEVATLVSWNGTALFYELAPELAQEPRRPRLVNQLFNHRGGWIEHYGPRLVESVDVHLAVNRPIARSLRDERGVPEERLAVVHHGVVIPEPLDAARRAELRQEVRAELGLPPEAVVAGTFIRLHEQKRPRDLLALARRCPEICFLLAGGGPLDAVIDRELAERPVANLVRLPMQHEVERLFHAIDLCLMTSAYEGLPVFLLEGMARGLPAVSTAVGDIPELLAAGGGRVAAVGDLDALAVALDEMRDPARRAAAGEIGRVTVEKRFGVERYVRELEEVIFPSVEVA